MDCHLENTHWSLLGVFKHQNYDDWMEQLFKHEGMCVWTEEEYAFMKNTRESWPQGCTISGKQTADGEDLYYNLKPMKGGRISVGLYVDNRCVVDYSAESSEIEDLLGNFLMNNGDSHDSGDNNYDFSGETLEESMERWNSAFDVWRTCHPCVAYDLENTSGNMYTGDDYQQNDDQANRKLGGEYSAQGDVFECYDDAGYTNVNQVRK